MKTRSGSLCLRSQDSKAPSEPHCQVSGLSTCLFAQGTDQQFSSKNFNGGAHIRGTDCCWLLLAAGIFFNFFFFGCLTHCMMALINLVVELCVLFPDFTFAFRSPPLYPAQWVIEAKFNLGIKTIDGLYPHSGFPLIPLTQSFGGVPSNVCSFIARV